MNLHQCEVHPQLVKLGYTDNIGFERNHGERLLFASNQRITSNRRFQKGLNDKVCTIISINEYAYDDDALIKSYLKT